MRNVEIKCQLRDRELALAICKQRGARVLDTLDQRDTYYDVPRGRLKRRETAGQLTQWVEYHRPDEAAARASNYALLDARAVAERYDLSTLRERTVVQKRRTLLMEGDVRIHLDQVDGLGQFLELEALVNERQNDAQAASALEDLLLALKPALGETCSESYADLVSRP
jgi:adenylate cyclase class IV